jgi:hypothetical protein
VVAWQTWFLATGASARWGDKFVFHFPSGPVFGWHRVGWPFLIPFVWTGLAIWSTRGRVLREPMVRLVLLCALVSLAIFLCFTESGVRSKDGNLGVPLQVSMAVLLILSVRAVGRQVSRVVGERTSAAGGNRQPLPSWLWVSLVATVLFVAAGIASYLDTLGVITVPIKWFPLY